MTVTLSISLVSHTNVGKTTLARTLLGRDVGEVRDAPHVTEVAEPHLLVESPDGDRLLLWDTPGFGDSMRLARRLAQAGNPLGWVMTEVWDRWRDRPFWASQRAIRHVLGEAEVALYMVSAAEQPEDAGYLASELQVLGLLGKPVVVLLNQLGPPGSADAEAQQVQQWQAHLARLAARPTPFAMARVQAVLPLDAFARCWVQERVLLQAVAEALPADRQPAMQRLTAAWAARQHSVWRQAMALLAGRLARAAADREALPQQAGWRAPLQRLAAGLGHALGLPSDADADPQARAMAALAARLDTDIRQSTDALIQLHGLASQASGEVLDQLARHFARRTPVDEGRAALWGGAVAGALAGLKADIASGGLTLGGGLLAGGVLGALGAAGAARGVNRLRGLREPLLAWDDAVLDGLLRAALLGYLAVAHHGRGRGDWRASEPPAAWGDAVDAALAACRPAVLALWQQRAGWLADAPGAADRDHWQAAVAALLAEVSADVLRQLYPDAARAAQL